MDIQRETKILYSNILTQRENKTRYAVLNIWNACLTLQRNFDLCIPRKGIERPQSQFHIHLSVSDLYIPTYGFLQRNRQTDRKNI